MALSGSFGSDVGPYWRLQLEWTATQNVGANTSTVTAKLYWMAQRSGVGAVSKSSTDPVSITINGQASPAASASPYLSAGQKKLIRTFTEVVNHNSDGSKTFNMSAYFDVNATLSGTYYGRRSISGSGTLNSIPRGSKLSGGASWTAGKDRTTSIIVYSGSFNHVIKYYVQNTSGTWVLIKEVDYNPGGTSAQSWFSTAQNKLIFQTLNGRGSAPSRIVVDTFSGSTFIAGDSTDGTVDAPLASFPEGPASFIVGGSFTEEAKWYLREFKHTIRLKTAINGTVLKQYTDIDSSVSFDTASIVATLRSQMASVTKKDYVIEVATYYDGVLVRDVKHRAIEARISNSYPTFTTTPVHRDTNATTVAITGNNQQIITGKSTVIVEIPAASRALPTDGATMTRYVATLGGKTVVQNWSASATVSFNFGTITAKTNQTLSIRAEDSRGASTIVTKTIPVIPYDPPTLVTMLSRVNGFEALTLLKMSGRMSALTVGGANKNSVLSSRFRMKETAVGTYGSWTTFPVTGFPDYTSAIREEVLDSTKSYHVQFEIQDKLSTTTVTKTVVTGKPLVFFDEFLNAVGIGDLPEKENELMVALQLRLAGNRFGANAGIDMQNSDIRNANGIFMNDVSSSSGEGINFLKTGAPVSSPSAADYETLRGLDGVVDFGNGTIAINFKEVHWEGGAFLHAPGGTGQQIPLIRPLSKCPQGIILLWSRYTSGAAQNSDWNVTFIPKNYNDYAGSSGMWCQLVAASVVDTAVPPVCFKYIYPRENLIQGHSRNGSGPESGQVLRAVLTI